jgi:hypothetical protein
MPAVVLAGAEVDYLEVVFGKAFLVALEQNDTEHAMVFARALLTRFPSVRPHPR